MQEGTELLPFLEGLAPLAARLPAREASAAAQDLRAVAAPHKPATGASERPAAVLCVSSTLAGALHGAAMQHCACMGDKRSWQHR